MPFAKTQENFFSTARLRAGEILRLLVCGIVTAGHVGSAYAEEAESNLPYTIRSVAPNYPPALRRDHIEGRVKAQIKLNIDGRIEDIKILESEPAGIFDQAVLDAVTQWRIQPKCGVRFDKPFTLERSFSFKLLDDNDDIPPRPSPLPESAQNLGLVQTESGTRIAIIDPCKPD